LHGSSGRARDDSVADDGNSQAAWTAAIARGDREAFARFYDVWFDRVHAVARRLARGPGEDHLDLVHEVMLKVVHRMVPLRDQRAVDAWMARAILTTVLDRRRVELRRRRRETAVAVAADATLDGAETLAHALLSDERLTWLRAELGRLPERDRLALRARFEDGSTFAEIGALLNTTGDAAHGRIRRALAHLARRAREVFGHA